MWFQNQFFTLKPRPDINITLKIKQRSQLDTLKILIFFKHTTQILRKCCLLSLSIMHEAAILSDCQGSNKSRNEPFSLIRYFYSIQITLWYSLLICLLFDWKIDCFWVNLAQLSPNRLLCCRITQNKYMVCVWTYELFWLSFGRVNFLWPET